MWLEEFRDAPEQVRDARRFGVELLLERHVAAGDATAAPDDGRSPWCHLGHGPP
jgi:hypothetical protein